MTGEDFTGDASTIAHGWLDVGDGHTLFWEEWGRAGAGTPIVLLHGGPGAGCVPSHKDMFDPSRDRVFLLDQRGAGRSRPSGHTEHNTTQDLIADIDRLRSDRGLARVRLAGGSWGSTLALLYALERPEVVERMVLWSVYLARQVDNDHVNEGHPRVYFPEAWRRFIAPVPLASRGTGDDVMAWYAAQVRSSDEAHARRMAIEWTLWEATLCSIEYDPAQLLDEVREDPATLASAMLETHYFQHGCFIEAPILERVAAIAHIPCHVVHGRFDLCTPAAGALELAEAYGPNLRLEWVNSGHLRTDPQMRDALREAAGSLLG
jgi:proline iminopeptidase